MKRFLSLCLLMAVLFSLSACFSAPDGTVYDKLTRILSPAPSPTLEENSILRRPDAAADVNDYAAVTETAPPDTQPTDAPEPSDPTETAPPPQIDDPGSKETRLSFVAVGDNIIHSAIIEDGKKHAGDGEEYNFNYIYDNVRDVISAADIAFVNQETPLGGKSLGYYGYPNFNGPQEAGDALVNAGFDVVCIATNHMADMRDAGLQGTIDYWRKQPVTTIGDHLNKEDYETVRIHEKDGVKIAFLAYTYGTNGMSVSASSGLVVPYIKEDDIRRHVAAAKEQADLVFVNMHWGDDSSFTVNADQKKYAQILADCGVDVVIGEHPHVLQPMQWMEGKDGNKMLLTYSIGNFLSTMYNDYFMVGGMLSFDIVKDKNGTRVEAPLLIPTVTYYDVNRANLSIYFLDEFTPDLASSHGTNEHGATSIEKLRGYVTKAIPKEFLPTSYQ